MADTVGTGTEHLTAFNPLQFLADSAACFLLEAGNHLLGKLVGGSLGAGIST